MMAYLCGKSLAISVALLCFIAVANAAPAMPISMWPNSAGIPYTDAYGITMDSSNNVFVTRAGVVSAIPATVWNNASWVASVVPTNIYTTGTFNSFITTDNTNLFVSDTNANVVRVLTKSLTSATVRTTISGQGANPIGLSWYNNQLYAAYLGAYSSQDATIKIWNFDSAAGTLGTLVRTISGTGMWDPYQIHVDDRGIFAADAYSAATAIWWLAHNGTKYSSFPCYTSCVGLTVVGNFAYYTTLSNLIMILQVNNATRTFSYYGNYSIAAMGGNRGDSLFYANGRILMADGYNSGSNKLWALDVNDCVDGSRDACSSSNNAASVCINQPGADRVCGCSASNATFTSCGKGRFAGPCNCICESSYYGASCATKEPTCTPLQINSTDVIGRTPTANADKTKFEGNILSLSLKAPYVKDRTFVSADFDGSTDSRCRLTSSSNVNGSFWYSGALQQSCQDELKFVLPWSAKNGCGFKVNNTVDSMYSVQTGKVTLSYLDVVGVMENTGLTLTRTTDLEFPVTVMFPKFMTVQLQKMNVTTEKAVAYMEVALVNEKYDQTTNALALTLLSASSYPHKLSSKSKFSVSSSNKNVKVISTTIVTAPGGDCNAPGQTCLQQIVMNLQIVSDEGHTKRTTTYDTSCDETFSGDYSVITTLYACREDAQDDCASANVTVEFSFISSSSCATVFTMDVPTLAASMKPYATADFTLQPKANFNMGEKVFFSVSANAGLGNTLKLAFLDISFNANNGDGEKFLLRTGQNTASGNTTSLTLFNNYFSFFLHGAVFPMGSGVGSYTIVARCAVTYEGNRKRIVNLSMEMDRSGRSVSNDESEVTGSTRITVVKKRALTKPAKQTKPQQHQQTKALVKTGDFATFAGVAVGATLCVLLVVVLVAHKKWVNYSQQQ